MSHYKPYPAYKDSGVEWLGLVPEHWQVKKLKWLASLQSGDFITSESIEEEGAYPVYGGNGLRGYCTSFTHEGTYALVGRQGALCGNINYAAGKFWASEHAVVVSPYESTAVRWLGELLRAMNLGQYSISSAQPGLAVERIIDLPLPVPPEIEREAIAGHIDRETARIDALVEKKTHFVELLREKRQALITHAVTKGLDPNVKLKDSGLEWLGEVPEHWSIKPFKVCIDFQEGPGIMAVDFRDEGTPLLRVAGVQGRWATLAGCNYLEPDKVERQWKHFRLVPGDLLISASASMGTVCEVADEAAGSIAYTGLIRLRGKKSVMLRSYIRSLVVSSLFSTQIDLFKAGSTIQHFGPIHLSQMFVVCPPLDEQEAIAQHVESETLRIDELIAKSERSVELLKERRSALITAAVTGQIDLRETV